MTPRDFFSLCKPKITIAVMLLFILSYLGASGFYLKEGFLLALLGVLTLSCGGCILNNYFDRDIDAKMTRTKSRPLPDGRVGAKTALISGLILALISLVISIKLGPLPFGLFLLGILSYVVVYTILAKRRSSLSVLTLVPAISSPIWLSWYIADGFVGPKGFMSGLTMAFWGLMHFWSLALVYPEDYIKADIPILPVKSGFKKGKNYVIISCLAFVSFAHILWLVGLYGLKYAIFITPPSLVILYFCVRLIQKPTKRQAYQIFKLSTMLLMLIIVAMVIDGIG